MKQIISTKINNNILNLLLQKKKMHSIYIITACNIALHAFGSNKKYLFGVYVEPVLKT